MAIKPDRHQNNLGEVYNLADVFVRQEDGTPYDFGNVENTYVSDNIIYFYCVPLERGIALKAFFDSFKINFTKKIDKVKKEDSSRDKIKEYASDLSYDITLNVPAHSLDESKNNLGKISDLQRLIAPINNFGGPLNPIGVSKLFASKVPYFSVWFKNLISSGIFYSKYQTPINVSDADIINHGFICLIEEIKYEPDIEKGFFDADNYLFPKNIKLTLKLEFRIQIKGITPIIVQRSIDRLFPKDIPFFSFNSNGHYSSLDSGLFPFGVGSVSKFKENYSIRESMKEVDEDFGGIVFDTDDMNNLDSSFEGNYDKTRIFISMNHSEDRLTESANFTSPDNTRRRYVCFKGYIDSFDRSAKMAYSTNDDKTKILGTSTVDLSTKSLLDELNFNVSFSVPAGSLIEAKKNCAKIGSLLRMSMKRADKNITPASVQEYTKKLKQANGKVKVYIPHIIESSSASKYVKSFASMYDSAIDLFITNFTVDIDVEKGFYDDPSGKLWPKNFKISLSFDTDSPNYLLKNYTLENEYDPPFYSTEFADGEDPKEDEDPSKFPFARETNKVTILR